MATSETTPPRRICKTCDFWDRGYVSVNAHMQEMMKRKIEPFGGESEDSAKGPDEDGMTFDESVAFEIESSTSSCRRNPPDIDGEWPQTYGADWCGEWQPHRKDRGGDHE